MLMGLGSTLGLEEIGKRRQDTMLVNQREETLKGVERQPIKTSLRLEPAEREGKAFQPRKSKKIFKKNKKI